MKRKEITVKLDSGLDTRPVALLVQVASQFRSDIYLESGNTRVNAKSIMGMMTLGLVAGEDVMVTAEGPDEEEAMDQVEAYLTKKK
ncbi:MAG: HPr family phosphocarrier protein [Lachnospiraceae bacterium]|nr:HPr family phosphocarrier protein [Lachnospiraceae bacterium]